MSERRAHETAVQKLSRFEVPEAETFIQWMQGIGLRHSLDRQEPFEWVLDDLATAYDQSQSQTALAELARGYLVAYSKDDLPASILNVEKFVYNLLQVCSGLSRPEQLWRALYQIYKVKGRGLGEWEGKPIQIALRGALLSNQGGPELRGEWMKILNGEHSALGSRIYDAWWGLLRMPAAERTLGSPWMEAIGEGFLSLARTLETSPNRQLEFRNFLSKAADFWRCYPYWDAELLREALNCHWPKWAVWRLTTITTPVPHQTNRWYVWDFVKESIPEQFAVKTLNAWPGARVSEIETDDEARLFLLCVAPLFEQYRLAASFDRDNSMRAALAYVLNYLERRAAEQEDHENPADVKLFWRARKQILNSLRNAVEGEDLSHHNPEDDRRIERRIEAEKSAPNSWSEVKEALARLEH